MIMVPSARSGGECTSCAICHSHDRFEQHRAPTIVGYRATLDGGQRRCMRGARSEPVALQKSPRIELDILLHPDWTSVLSQLTLLYSRSYLFCYLDLQR